MPRLLPPLVGLVLAATAVFLHLPAMKPKVTPFTRGSFAVLTEAEEALRAGEHSRALNRFRTAYVRAIFESRPGIAERVRLRTGLAGRELLDNPAGVSATISWPFLEAFALWSDDFNRDASGIEDAYLSRPTGQKKKFEYHLTRPDGCSFWAGQPSLEWTGIWPFLHAWNETTTNPLAKGLYKEKHTSWPNLPYALMTPLFLRSLTLKPIQAEIAVSCGSNGAQCLYSPPWPSDEATLVARGHWKVDRIFAKKDQGLNRVLVFTDVLPGPKSVSITLVREYHPL